MEDKTFQLIEKMYSEFIGLREDMNEFRKETNSRFDKVEADIQAFKNDVLEMEQDHGKKLQVLFDGHVQQDRKQEEYSKQLADIENKVDYIAMAVTSQDKRLKLVEASKKKAK